VLLILSVVSASFLRWLRAQRFASLGRKRSAQGAIT
jgi:hypothetical protein